MDDLEQAVAEALGWTDARFPLRYVNINLAADIAAALRAAASFRCEWCSTMVAAAEAAGLAALKGDDDG